MKFRYFSSIAERSFVTSPSGERLFYLGLPWSRPYIIPDETTEKRLFRKQLWLMRFLLGTLILGQPFLFLYVPNVVNNPLWFIGCLFGVIFLSWIIIWLVFHSDCRNLQRTETRIPRTAFYQNMARRHGKIPLLLGFLLSLTFVVLGIWLVFDGMNIFIGLVNIALFGAASVGWGYVLYLKLSSPKAMNKNDSSHKS